MGWGLYTDNQQDFNVQSRAGTPSSGSTPSDAVSGVQQPADRMSLAVVVPCFNERDGIGLLAESLDVLEQCLDSSHQLEFVLVDDCSSDDTLSRLRAHFDAKPHYRILSHPGNYGIAAALNTGLRSTTAEIVACIDADCTYHPNQLLNLLPLMKSGISVVTASPYHPRGRVDGVIGWRLTLSKSASWIYARLLRTHLYTYTSCFRLYRRVDALHVGDTRPGFVGITEILWKIDRNGGRILEVPAILRSRQHGVSKMNVMKTGMSHLALMTQVLWCRLQDAVQGKRRQPESVSATTGGSDDGTDVGMNATKDVRFTESR